MPLYNSKEIKDCPWLLDCKSLAWGMKKNGPDSTVTSVKTEVSALTAVQSLQLYSRIDSRIWPFSQICTNSKSFLFFCLLQKKNQGTLLKWAWIPLGKQTFKRCQFALGCRIPWTSPIYCFCLLLLDLCPISSLWQAEQYARRSCDKCKCKSVWDRVGIKSYSIPSTAIDFLCDLWQIN